MIVDDVGNHKNEWKDYFSCSAYASTSGTKQSEQQAAGITVSDNDLVFTVRCSSELSDLDTTHYRIVFRNETYNITSIDRMNYMNKSLKISCEREKRNILCQRKR